MKTIYIYYYAVKYWAQGDDWADAVNYAERIVKGFR